MSNIITGNFATKGEADRAITSLTQMGIARDGVCSFALNPPGQHDTFPIGGDHDASPGAKHAGTGAAAGAAIGGAVGTGLGLAAAVVAGPLAVAGGAAVGAYMGSLAGALNALGDETAAVGATPEEKVHPAGVLVAVHAPVDGEQIQVVDALRVHGAREVQVTQGIWEDGVWSDYDVASPSIV